MKRAWLEIDFAKLKNNYEIAKRLVKGKEILGVVKADGYGCGDVAIAKELTKLGVKIFGVACLKEGVKLRKNGIQGKRYLPCRLWQGGNRDSRKRDAWTSCNKEEICVGLTPQRSPYHGVASHDHSDGGSY